MTALIPDCSRPKTTVIVFFAVVSFSLFSWNAYRGFRLAPGGDFSMRYNEVECIGKGIDPWDVISGRCSTEEYTAAYPVPSSPPPRSGAKPVHVYTPWEYTFLLPFTILPRASAGTLFLALSVAALAAVGIWAFRAGKNLAGDWRDGLFCAAAALFSSNAAAYLFECNNYGGLHAFFLLLLALALQSRRDVLAGVCWAFLMIKPQTGLLFAIPLLLRRRFLAVGVAVAVCLAASIPPSLLCGKSPFELILDISRGGMPNMVSNGTMLVPAQVFAAFAGHCNPFFLELASMAIGAAICFVLVWRLRRDDSWFAVLAPVAVCSILWAYSVVYDRVLLWLPQFLMAFAALRKRRSRSFVLCLLVFLVAAWPFVYDQSLSSKLLRRVSLAAMLVFAWLLPRWRLSAPIGVSKHCAGRGRC